MWVFENRVLMTIFGPKRVEVTGEWGKLHNGELNDLYCSPNFLRMTRTMSWAGHVVRMVRGETCTGFWWGKTEGKGPLGRPRRRWEDNIKIYLQEVGCGDMDWIVLAQDSNMQRALVKAVMNRRVA